MAGARAGDRLATTLAGGLIKGNPQFGATGGKPVSGRSLRALDGANFFLSDARDGIGPYLGIYLLASHHWDAHARCRHGGDGRGHSGCADPAGRPDRRNQTQEYC